MFKKISNYIKDVQNEMSKVSWPTRSELYESTVIVIFLSIILAIFVFSVDTGLTAILKIIL